MKRLRKRLFGTRRATAMSVTALVLVLVTSAAAAWLVTSTGTNVFRGKSGQALVAPTLAAPGFAEMTGDCTPGSGCTAYVKATNNNAGVLQAINVTIEGAITTENPTSCPAANFTYNAPHGDSTADAIAPVNVPTGQTVLIPVPNVVQMASDAPQTCANLEILFTNGASVGFSTP